MVSVEEIKSVIVSQKEEIEEIFGKENIIERRIEKTSPEKYLKRPNILAVVGVRRCGKSTLCWRILRNKKFAYINFDDERLYGVEAQDLDKILQAFYELYGTDLEYILLDEIQNVDRWELFANRLRRTKKVIVTGSNSKLLSGELASRLTGRYLDITIFPFSFREFLLFSEFSFSEKDVYSTKKKSRLMSLLEKYMRSGGFPETHKLGPRIPLKVYEDIINKDVIQRHKIRYKKALKDIAKYLISNTSSEISFTKLKNICSIKDVHTIRNYVSYLESAYLVFILERFSFKLKEQIIAPKKVYCIDPGIINSISFSTSGNIGNLMENIVAIEFLNKTHNNNLELYYWKDHQEREADFIIKKGSKIKQIIQVTHASDRKEIRERELKSLSKASEELKCNNLLVITWDLEKTEKFKGKRIKYTPLWKWLLLSQVSNLTLRII